MKTLKKGIALLLGIMLCISLLPAPVYAVSDDTEAADIPERQEERSAGLMETYSGSCGDNLIWTLDTSSGKLVITGTGYMDEWDFYSLSYPGWNRYCDLITSVTIGQGVVSVGSWAFWGCGNLTSVEIPDSVTIIGYSAFNDCASLTEIRIPEHMESIGSEAFYGCSSLTSFRIPSGITYLPDSLFQFCTSLASVTIPDGVEVIDNEVFCGCSSLAEVNIPSSVYAIRQEAFEGCSSLTHISIPENVWDYGSDVFAGCDSLTSAGPTMSGCSLEFGWTTEIPDNAFSNCTGLISVTLPANAASIGQCCFLGCSKLKSVSIPSGVTSIGWGAFRNCSSLTSITIPSGVSRIDPEDFDGCFSLAAFNIEPGNPSYTSENGVLFNAGKTKLLLYPAGKTQNEYLIPDSVTSIGPRAFYGCGSLERVVIPGGVTELQTPFVNCAGLKSAGPTGSGKSIEFGWTTSIPSSAFSQCDSLIEVTVPGGITSIGGGSFSSCGSLAYVSIPRSVTSIGGGAFANCSSLKTVFYGGSTGEQWSAISIESGNDPLLNAEIEYVGTELVGLEYCIENGEAIITGFTEELPEAVRIPSSIDGCPVTEIAANAFADSSLRSLSLSRRVTAIGSSAFSNCTGLLEVHFKVALKTVGSNAFSSCTALTKVIYDGNKSQWSEIGIAVGNEALLNAEIEFRSGSATGFQYKIEREEVTITGFTDDLPAAAIIPDMIDGYPVTGIAEEAFSGCERLSGIEIPASVVSMGARAFSGCPKLTGAGPIGSGCNIEFGWTSDIPDNAFFGCESLKSVTIPSGVTRIGAYAFIDCSDLTSLALPEGLTDMGVYAFSGTGLTSAAIPSSMTSISEGAFSLCGNLISVTLPDGLKSVGEWAFDECNSLTDITIPDSVTTIGVRAFSRCRSLTKIVIPSGVTRLDSWTFEECDSLSSVTIPASVQEVWFYPFYGCPKLTSAGPIGSGCNIEFGWTNSIPDGAFRGCYYLTTVTIPSGVTTIGREAFSECNRLTEIVLPETLTSIGERAFLRCFSLENINWPASVTMIKDGMFQGCSSLGSFIIPSDVTTIGAHAFYGCTSLTSVSISNSVTDVGSDAFADCQNLQAFLWDGRYEEWKRFAEAQGLDESIGSTWTRDESLAVTITTEEVPGGVVVRMSAPGGVIYYRLDWGGVNEYSTPYQGAFLIDKEGAYGVAAIAIDRPAGTYGEVNCVNVFLDQSAPPEIYKQGDLVYMNASLTSGGIYYTSDLTREPDLDSDCYAGPIQRPGKGVFRARVIENGKAKSEIISRTFFSLNGGIRYPEESYSFANTKDSFGYSITHRIEEKRYTEIFGFGAGGILFENWGSRWGGSCFGMSATSLLFSNGVLNLGDYSNSAQTVNGLTAPKSKESELTKLIERYQVAQFLPVLVTERNDRAEGGNMVISGLAEEGAAAAGDALIRAVQSACGGGDPIILILWKDDLNGSHAVVPYRLEGDRIFIYDCNRPNEECAISWRKDGEGIYRFSYGEYSYAVSYNSLNKMMEGLEGLQTGRVVLQADGKEQMLVSLNTTSFAVYDRDGNEVRDYITVRATEDMQQSAETMLYLDVGDYTICSTDIEQESFTLSAATEKEYHTVTVADPAAQIRVTVEYGHLSVTVTAEEETDMRFRTSNASGRENEIEITAKYAKIYACTDLVTLVESTARSVIGNGETCPLMQNEKDTSIYYGAVGTMIKAEAREVYGGYAGVGLSTDIGELLEQDFTLTANVTGAGERARVFAASYDADGRMTDIRGWETQAGKTKYPFTIAGGTAEVKLFVLDLTSGEPLTESLTLRQG